MLLAFRIELYVHITVLSQRETYLSFRIAEYMGNDAQTHTEPLTILETPRWYPIAIIWQPDSNSVPDCPFGTWCDIIRAT